MISSIQEMTNEELLNILTLDRAFCLDPILNPTEKYTQRHEDTWEEYVKVRTEVLKRMEENNETVV